MRIQFPGILSAAIRSEESFLTVDSLSIKSRRILLKIAVLTCTLSAFPTWLIAQTKPEAKFAPMTKGLVLPDVECSEFHSKFTGHDYNVYVSLPESYSKGDQRYPVLYVPDSDEQFLSLKIANRLMSLSKLAGDEDMLEEFILVGVPLKWEDVAEWVRNRAFDLTPTDVEAFDTAYSKKVGGEIKGGGAPLFLRTLKEELIPFIESKYRVTSDRGLAGDSFGGLFALYVWLNDANTFSRYLIGSPSLWWDKEMILKAEAAAAASGKTLQGRVFLSIGADEGEHVTRLKNLTTALKSHAYPNLQLESHIFEGENHYSVLQATFSRGLRFLYAKNTTWSDPSPHKSGFVTANGIRINYLDWGGSGPALILIHGQQANPHWYDDFATAFTDRFRVIAYARRGAGDSEAKEPYDAATLTEDLRGLMDALGIRKAHLVGHSMGGTEITFMASTHPERVDRIVYLEAAYDFTDPLWKEAVEKTPASSSPTQKDMASLDAFRKWVREVGVPSVSNPSIYEALLRDAIVIQPDGSVRFKMAQNGALQALEQAANTRRKDYAKVHSPALAIYAENFGDLSEHQRPDIRADGLVWEQKYVAPFRAASIERVKRELPNVEVMTVPCAHNDLIFVCRDAVVAAMRRFLSESKVSALQSPLVGPLVKLSQPNTVVNCSTGPSVFGSWSTDNAVEPFVAVNPVHPDNIVAAWMQGPGQAIVASVSLDRGNTWRRVPIPVTTCSGGQYPWTGDEWLSFSPNGDLYAIAGGVGTKAYSDIRGLFLKSSDGGLHWSAAKVLPASNSADAHPDHGSLTADPADARFVYLVWEEYPRAPSTEGGSQAFTRSTDGGVTWEAPRVMVKPAEHRWPQFSQVLALPNGTLVDIYEFHEFRESLPKGTPPVRLTGLQLLRSTDHGATWSAPSNAVTMTPLRVPKEWAHLVVPKTGKFVTDVPNPSFAVDSRNGSLFAVWEDGRFSNSQYNDIAFSMSADGGSTWSDPIRVNKTPLSIPTTNRDAFHPSIAVARNGAIAVSYYDFRFNDTSPGLLTDRWLVQCHPSSPSAPSDPACWGDEVRLTDKSFNMEDVPMGAYGFFLGDYFGLASAGDAFVAVFTQPDDHKITSIFVRRVGP